MSGIYEKKGCVPTIVVQIAQQDIDGAGHGNADDPLVRALNRTQLPPREWRSEIYSRGVCLIHGSVWDEQHGNSWAVDIVTTRALQVFDTTLQFSPREARLFEIEDADEWP